MSIRAWAARTWLEILFWCTAHAPLAPRILRPIMLLGTWQSSRWIRDGTMANARRILGEASTIADRRRLGKRVVASFYDAVVDFGRNRRLTRDQLLSRIERVEGLEEYEQARRLKRGAILVTAHLGPFETAVASLLTREPRVHVVFRRDTVPLFERLRTEQRRRLGVIEAPIDDGLITWARLRDALLADEVVLMQGDRTMVGQRGVAVPFLHGHMEIPEGPAKLARLTGSPLVPTFAILTPRRRIRILIGKPILVAEGAGIGEIGGSGERGGAVSQDDAIRRLAGAIADVVRQYPEQWLVLEKAWLEDRGETRVSAHTNADRHHRAGAGMQPRDVP